MKKLIVISLCVLMAVAAEAGVKPKAKGVNRKPKSESACESSEWAFSREQSKQDFAHIFARVQRSILIANLFHEVTEPSKPGLPYYLVTYLSRTEQNRDMQGFFELVKWGAELQDEKSVPKKIEFDEVCKYYEKALAFKNEAPKE
jgi:hypothetical protein